MPLLLATTCHYCMPLLPLRHYYYTLYFYHYWLYITAIISLAIIIIITDAIIIIFMRHAIDYYYHYAIFHIITPLITRHLLPFHYCYVIAELPMPLFQALRRYYADSHYYATYYATIMFHITLILIYYAILLLHIIYFILRHAILPLLLLLSLRWHLHEELYEDIDGVAIHIIIKILLRWSLLLILLLLSRLISLRHYFIGWWLLYYYCAIITPLVTLRLSLRHYYGFTHTLLLLIPFHYHYAIITAIGLAIVTLLLPLILRRDSHISRHFIIIHYTLSLIFSPLPAITLYIIVIAIA